MTTEEKRLSILAHIGEMRIRLLRSFIVVLVIFMVCFFAFRNDIFNILLIPAPESLELISVSMTGGINTVIMVCLVAALIVATPYLLFEFFGFISPALNQRERKIVYIMLPWVIIMFAGGVALSYFIVTPHIINFLFTFTADLLDLTPQASDYVIFVTKFIVTVGLVFEFPVITTILARIGLLKPEWLSSKWRWGILLSFVVGAIMSPPEPISQIMLAVPLMLLYGMSVWLAKLMAKQREKSRTTAN